MAVETSAPSVPPGGTAQVRLTLARPHQLSSGSLSLDFDPAIFGPPVAVDVFSATGDQVGRADLTGNHLDVEFRSDTGGIGRLPGAPLLVVTIPVLGSTKDGAATSISFSPGDKPWKDVLGYQYTPSVAPARFRVGGALSIDSVTPGGGLLPSGTKVRVAGRGLVRSTEVRIDGVVLASVSFVSPQALDVTLGAPADLTGRRVLVRNPDGSQADFYPALARKFYDPPYFWPGAVQPIFPQQAYVFGNLGVVSMGRGAALQNPSLAPTPVVFDMSYQRTGHEYTGRSTRTLEPGEMYLFLPFPQLGSTSVSVSSETPIRMMLLEPATTGEGPRPLLVTWDGPNPGCVYRGDVKPTDTPCWLAVAGATPLKSHVKVAGSTPVPFAVFVSAEGGPWLTLSTEKGTACVRAPCDPQITLTADPRIPPGDYKATLTFTAEDTTLLPVTLAFIFRVVESVISVEDPQFIFFSINESIYSRGPARVRVNSTADPMPFSVSIRRTRGSDWISVTPTQGVTPATLEIYVNPVPPETFGTAIIDVLGPFNTVTVVVIVNVGSPPPPAPALSANPSSLAFWAKAGGQAPDSQSVNVPLNIYTVTAVTEQGGPWLSVENASGGSLTRALSGLSVKVDAAGLKAGVYRGSVTFAVSNQPDVPPGRIPVTLVVWQDPPEVVLSPPELTVSSPSGAYPQLHSIAASSAHGPVSLAASATTEDGSRWLAVFDQFYRGYFYAPAPYGSARVTASGEDLPPGTYRGSIRVIAPVGSPVIRTVPVTLKVEPGLPPYPRPGPPLAVSMVNAASLTGGPIAPGELVTFLGLNLGPHSPAHFSVGGDGKVTTSLGGLRVLFDGVPAPLLYASDVQVNAVVPYEVEGKTSVPIAVEFNGLRFTTGVPISAAAPALFTIDGTGRGQAVASNQDGSANGVANPAARGWEVRFLATGVGRTTPAGTTGEILRDQRAEPALPVAVKIGGVAAAVRQMGAVPGQVAGLFQLTVVVPAEVTPGPSVPVVLTVGSFSSPDGVTVAVR